MVVALGDGMLAGDIGPLALCGILGIEEAGTFCWVARTFARANSRCFLFYFLEVCLLLSPFCFHQLWQCTFVLEEEQSLLRGVAMISSSGTNACWVLCCWS